MTSSTHLTGTKPLFIISTIARLPLATLGIGLLAHAAQVTGSFASAGVVAGAYAAALGLGGPVAARQADRVGHTVVLSVTSIATAALLLGDATLPVGTPIAVPIALAIGIGLATPPVGASVRTILPAIVTDEQQRAAAFALESTVAELTWVFGPAFTLGVAAIWTPAASLALSALVTVSATLALAALPTCRTWTPVRSRTEKTGALSSAGVRTLTLMLIALGVLFGALEVAVTAAGGPSNAAASAAPMLALWGLGSVIGGITATRWAAPAGSINRLAALLALLTVSHLALISVVASRFELGALLVLAGAAIAPTFALVFALVDRLAPEGTHTEAFAWLATAEAIGSAIGSTVGGSISSSHGAAAGLSLAALGGAVALAILLSRRRTLAQTPTPSTTRRSPQVADDCLAQAV